MKVTMESTNKIVQINGVNSRIYEGVTESGIHFTAFMTYLKPDDERRSADLGIELGKSREPSPANVKLASQMQI
jgi:hypothetical protein